MVRNKESYIKVTQLREEGFSYNEILEKVVVAQSTISRWCQGIDLTPEQKERLIEKKRNTPLIKKLKEQAIANKKEASFWAKQQIDKIKERDIALMISAVMLYWAEGSSSVKTKKFEFTNTDARMVKLMIRFLESFLEVSTGKIIAIVRVRRKENIIPAEKYWSRITGIPRRNFRKAELIKPISSSKEKYPHGICRISVYNISCLRKIKAFINGYCKLFNID